MPVPFIKASQVRKLSGSNAAAVLAFLCERSDAYGTCSFSLRDMEKELEIVAGAINRINRELEEKGFIVIERARSGQNVYTLLHARQRAAQLDQRAGSPSPVVVTPAGRNAGIASETAAFSSPDIDPAQRPIIHVM